MQASGIVCKGVKYIGNCGLEPLSPPKQKSNLNRLLFLLTLNLPPYFLPSEAVVKDYLTTASDGGNAVMSWWACCGGEVVVRWWGGVPCGWLLWFWGRSDVL